MKKTLFLIAIMQFMINCKTQQASTPVESTPNVSITSIEWKLTRMSDRDMSVVNPQADITLLFDEAQKGISGHGGCNRYFAGYQLSRETISFTGIGSTKMYCQDKQALEDAYFKALSLVDTYRTEGNKLYLLAEGKVVLEFSK